MMTSFRILILMFFYFFSTASSWAQETSSFYDGLKAFKSGEITQARELFSQAAKNPENRAASLINLALIELSAEHKGLALAYLREALALAPGDSKLKSASEYASTKLGYKVLDSTQNSKVLENFLRTLSPISLWIFTWVLLLVLTILATHYLKKLKLSRESEQAPPPLPVVGIVVSLFLILSLFLSTYANYIHFTVRGTVISEKASLRSGPSQSEVVLAEVGAGEEVTVLKQQGYWAQVSAQSGASGWVYSDGSIRYY